MKENSKIFLLILLGMLTAFGPFVTDMYLPTLPAMGQYFNTTSSMVQLGLTTSMTGLAAGQLLFGPLSDRYGRKRPLVVAMWLFIVSTLCCIFAKNIGQFVAFRLVQGIAGAGGIVISRSIATDKYAGRELAKMLAVIGAINGIAPVAAPIVGGAFTESIGWQGIFCILLGLGTLLLAGSYRFRESLPREQRLATGWGDTFRGFKTALRDRNYVCYVLQMGSSSARVMDERALACLKTHTDRLMVLDALEYGMADVDEGVRAYLEPALFYAMNVELRAARGKRFDHSPEIRRYMGIEKY